MRIAATKSAKSKESRPTALRKVFHAGNQYSVDAVRMEPKSASDTQKKRRNTNPRRQGGILQHIIDFTFLGLLLHPSRRREAGHRNKNLRCPDNFSEFYP